MVSRVLMEVPSLPLGPTSGPCFLPSHLGRAGWGRAGFCSSGCTWLPADSQQDTQALSLLCWLLLILPWKTGLVLAQEPGAIPATHRARLGGTGKITYLCTVLPETLDHRVFL